MKLRNKKTGEIKECVVIPIDSNGYPNEYQEFEKGESLAELNEEWEDAPEEPKEYWYIDIDGEIMFDNVEDDTVKVMREIGNYFETKEEAEQAVEKLKAAKRLKDKGFRFTGYDTNYGHHRASFVFEKEAWATETEPDLDLLFGGEE